MPTTLQLECSRDGIIWEAMDTPHDAFIRNESNRILFGNAFFRVVNNDSGKLLHHGTQKQEQDTTEANPPA